MKKTRKKTNIKRFSIILIIILLGVLVFLGYRNIKVKNVYVVGNKRLKEYEVIELANLKDYPYLYQTSNKKIEEGIKTNPLVKDVTIKKTLLGKITIILEENRVLYQDNDGKYVLSNNSKIDLETPLLGIPTMINNPEDEEEKLINKMVIIDKDILERISEIEYKPNDLDKERFMFYMSDGNYVYVTLNKINLINSYNEIYPTLEGKKGILYLDSGNHFEIKNNNA